MKKLQRYKTFENQIVEEDDDFVINGNHEEEIEKVLNLLVQQKVLISMLGDTINHVSKQIEKVLPEPLETFTEALKQYNNDVYECVDEIIENMIQGYPNIKDLVDDVENDIVEIENYLKSKK